jgi:nicotinate-nucleotide pyrophosphorylase (carboxylating)
MTVTATTTADGIDTGTGHGRPGPEFGEALRESAGRLIRLALAEDCGVDPDDDEADYVAADVTTVALVPPDLPGRAEFVAKSEGVIAGLPVAGMVFEEVDPSCRFAPLVADGTFVRRKAVVAEVFGPYRSLLTAERTALNLLQRLSGVATLTHRFTVAVGGTRAEIIDTRKTAPGMRLLEKYAVRCGGGHNHRVGLHDMLLIKDNHLVAVGDKPADAVRLAKEAAASAGRKLAVEVEVTDLEQFEDALDAGPDFILLDNMSHEQMTEAVRRRDARFGKAAGPQLEASGGVTLETVAGIAKTGVERISVGALTHSAPALDISMEIALVG